MIGSIIPILEIEVKQTLTNSYMTFSFMFFITLFYVSGTNKYIIDSISLTEAVQCFQQQIALIVH